LYFYHLLRKSGFEAVVIGSSAGGLFALKTIFSILDPGFPVPVVVVQHLSPDDDNYLTNLLDQLGRLRVKEADEKETLFPGTAYIAPPNYHLLIERNRTFSLTVGERVNYARPSIDVLFETAAETFGRNLVGVVLTGANRDGSEGLLKIREAGGLTIVQDPTEAESPVMPRTAIATVKPHHILKLEEIANFLNDTI